MRAFIPHTAAVAALLAFALPASADDGFPRDGDPLVAYDNPPPGYSYADPPAHGGQSSGYVPPPPKRVGPEWNIRFNPFDLLEGRASGAVEYAVAGPLTVGVAPTYVYGRPVYEDNEGYDVGGWAIALQPAFWFDERPFRGLALKLHLEHESVTYRIKTQDGSEEKTSLGLNKIGAMIASQSIHGGWFSLSYGFGLKKNLSFDKEKHTVTCPGYPAGSKGCIVASGIGKGFEIVGELGLGVVF